MSVFNFFRNFFGGTKDKEDLKSDRSDDSYRNGPSFRKPIWQNDDDDNDDDDDFRRFGGGMHFSIFTDPLEITKYFEAQMDNMLKNFFSGFDHGTMIPFPEGNERNMLEPPAFYHHRERENLRAKMLKPGYEMPSDKPYDNKSKVDADLDGKVSADDFSRIWDHRESKKSPFTNFYHNSRLTSKKYIRRADGTIEEQQVIKDSDGNEETITSKQIGDKKYVISIKKDKDGKETKTEDLINMDENELKEFKQKWETPSNPTIDNSDNPSKLLKYFPWEKFFDVNPKL